MAGLEGMDALFDVLDGLKQQVLEAGKEGMDKGLKDMAADAKMKALEDTGELRNKIFSESEIVDDTVEGHVVSGAEHSVYIEYGTGPKGQADHAGTAPIDVSYRQSGWTYYDIKQNRFVYTEGRPATPFMFPAYMAHRDSTKRNIQDAVTQTLKNIKGD